MTKEIGCDQISYPHPHLNTNDQIFLTKQILLPNQHCSSQIKAILNAFLVLSGIQNGNPRQLKLKLRIINVSLLALSEK